MIAGLTAGQRLLGDKVPVSYTAAAVTDAAAWAFGQTAPGTLVELPSRVPNYWLGIAGKAAEGSPAWRNAERQLLVSYAAMQDRNAAATAFRALQSHGGRRARRRRARERRDRDQHDRRRLRRRRLAGTDTLAARYLQAGRRYGKLPRADALVPATHDGAIGSLWSLWHVVAELADGRYKPAADALATVTGSELRVIGAAAIGQTGADADTVGRAWDSVATGAYKNVARAQAAQALYQRGSYDAAAERVVQLVADLDLDAAPPQLQMAPYMFQVSRRGQAGWQLVWAQWRDRVLDGGSFEHVMALFAATQQEPADMQRVLARAGELAGDDTDRVVMVAQTAWTYGQIAWAQSLLEPLLKKTPSRALYQLVAQVAQQQGRYADALADLEAAQDAGGDERVGITQVRSELGAILAMARQVAIQSTGKARRDALAGALVWGDRWRAIDPGNMQIDLDLGELELAVGDKAEAWRQLSSVIERDPMSGAGYEIVATEFEQQGRVADALDYWEQAIRIDQTDPTPRMHKAQALIALGRDKEGDAVLREIAGRKWHEKWDGIVYQVQDLLRRGR